MSLNWKEIDLILEELSLEGAFIQKVRQPSFHALLLDIYRPGAGRFPLLIELAPGVCRMHRLSNGIPYKKTVKLQRFAQLLRSRAQGGRIISCRQIASERIIEIQIRKLDIITYCYIRLWSNAANIIVVDQEHTILDAFYRRPRKAETSGSMFDPVPAPRKSLKEFSIRSEYDSTEGPFNDFIEHSYDTETAQQTYHALAHELQELLRSEELRRRAARDKRLQEQQQLGDYDRQRHYGDLLSANRRLILPHQRWVTVADYLEEDQETLIELDERLSPGENIERYYGSYHKMKGAYERISEEIASDDRILSEIAHELELLDDADRIIDEPAIDGIKQLIARYGRSGHQVQEKDASQIGLQFFSGSFTILVGRTSKENDSLLRGSVRGNDHWLHTRDCPGGYVFIKAQRGKSIPLEVLLDAGTLAVYYSKARNNGRADLYHTQVKHLRRAKDSKLGTVLPTHEKNLHIEIDQKRLDRLFSQENQ